MGKAEPNAAKGQPPDPDRRSFVTLPLAQLLPGVTRPAFRKRSPAGANLMADWATIVGQRLAAITEPRRLARGQLTIACAGPVAMELQHLQAELTDRINSHAGEALVQRLRFTQDLVADQPKPPIAKRIAPLESVAGLDGPLGDALANLWQAIREK